MKESSTGMNNVCYLPYSSTADTPTFSGNGISLYIGNEQAVPINVLNHPKYSSVYKCSTGIVIVNDIDRDIGISEVILQYYDLFIDIAEQCAQNGKHVSINDIVKDIVNSDENTDTTEDDNDIVHSIPTSFKFTDTVDLADDDLIKFYHFPIDNVFMCVYKSKPNDLIFAQKIKEEDNDND